jgi:hypothetical protein
VYNFNYTPATLEYTVKDKLHLGVREQKRLNTTALEMFILMENPPDDDPAGSKYAAMFIT